MPDERKATYGIIGNPLKHSLSPLMHNAAFKHLGVDAVYKLFPLEEDVLEGFFRELKSKASPVFGLNVTVPYKEKVLTFLDSLAPLAEKIGAVNTIVITKDRRFIGYNTDAPGFLTHLTELGFDTKEKYIAVLGAGGSSRAILTALCLIHEKPQTIKVYNRTWSKAEAIVKSLNEKFNTNIIQIVDNTEDLNLDLADLLINTTSIGMKTDDPMLIDDQTLHPGMLVYDLIYNPKETMLLKAAKAQGAKVSNGLGMLFYQGVLAFQHWADAHLDDETKAVMRRTLENET